MLRLAIYYENRLGRNDGNPLYVFRSLKRMQEQGLLEVDHLIPDGDLNPFGQYDANVWVDWGEDGLTGLLPYKPAYPPAKPLIYWASDTHLGYDYRLQCAKQADLTFCAQKRAVEEMKRDGVSNVHWLPHAVEPEAYLDPDSFNRNKPEPYNFLTKKYDVCFIGHINSANRKDSLDRLFREFPNFYYGQRLFNEAAEKYAQSKIVFNISMLDDLNMRVFEVLGSRSFLLTNHLPDIDEFFKEGVHLATYKTMDEMVEKAKYYLAHDDEREKIAQAGFEEVMKHHTIDHRVGTMLSHMKTLIKEEVNVNG